MKAIEAKVNLSHLIQDFFCKHLVSQRNLSPQTIAAYRDTFRLLLQYAAERIAKQPVQMSLNDLNEPLLTHFLNYLETERKNSIRTRNARFAAIRSFMKYAAYREPASLSVIQKVLAIPMKRFERPVLGFLSREEIEAILDAPDSSTWSGKRDRVMFTLFYNTGARVSEVISIRLCDLKLERTLSVALRGKGRKQRVIPLWKNTGHLLKEWLKVIRAGREAILFPSRYGKALSRSGIESRLKEAVKSATTRCPSLKKRRISPHTIRHSTAMHLLQSGVDLSVIALWLGHESPSTTHMYTVADLSMKEQALRKLDEVDGSLPRYRAKDKLLHFLEGL